MVPFTKRLEPGMVEAFLKCVVFVILLMGPSESRAQEGNVRIGKRIRVATRGGGEVVGRLAGVCGDTAIVSSRSDTTRIEFSTIDSAWIGSSHWKTGALVLGAAT